MKTAMIFAAGRGERLKPLTNHLPKALCDIQGKPLIDYHLEHLQAAGFERVIINLSHLGGLIRQHVNNVSYANLDIIFSLEPPGALETGGAIVNALPIIGKDPFVTINADVFTDYDFKQLALIDNYPAHLVLVPQNALSRADFGLSTAGMILNDDRQYTFSGIACYHPQLFASQPMGRYSVTPMLRALAEQQQLTGEIYSGTWFDIGTLERLEKARHFKKEN